MEQSILPAHCQGASNSELLLHLISTLVLTHCSHQPQYPPDRSENHYDSYDFIIVGAGSAGSALAAGLASNTKWNILLIEAGDDPKFSSEIPLFYFSAQNTSQDWQYKTEPQMHACGAYKDRRCAWPRGKLLGGCSAINAMIYHMGYPADYDEWGSFGNDGWDWNSVKHYFENHFKNNLSPELYDTQDKKQSIFTHMRQKILEAGKELGYKNIEGLFEKSQGKVGYYSIPGTVKNGQRNSAAKAYLVPIAKQENFHVIKNSEVTKLIINDNKKVEAVEVMIKGQKINISAKKEVIISAGAINTPKLLLLSGIGPKKHLELHGIKVVEDLPVGKNLQDHANTIVPIALTKNQFPPIDSSTLNDIIYEYFMYQKGILSTTGTANIASYYSAKDAESTVSDVLYHYIVTTKNDQVFLKNVLDGLYFNDKTTDKILESNLNSPTLIVLMVLLRPKARGTIELKSNDPLNPPYIDPNYFSSTEDLETQVSGLRHLESFVNTKIMQEEGAEFIDLGFDECQKYDKDSDEYRKCYIKQLTSTLYHPAGTASMGTDCYQNVVDSRLRVYGITGLRVADASVMPTITSGNTNAPAIMIGEKAADLIKEDWSNVEHSEL